MEELRRIAKELLSSNKVQVVIGYGQGSGRNVRPIFIKAAGQVDRLFYDERCTCNLALYLTKPEIKKLGKPAIAAIPTTLRAILQLASEFQFAEGDLVALAIAPDGKVSELNTFQEMEDFAAKNPYELSPQDREQLEQIEKMSLEERWQFWQEQLSVCFKCYACRSACPMCYCTRCTVECNQPQWIPAAAHELGNIEWHIMRAMHLVGRCVSCGECGRACPLGLPIHLLTMKMSSEALRQFGAQAGMTAKADFALSTFKPDDKENFIR